VVELASVIGGETFSDRPDCVCDVIAAFLRSWNDRASHADRQRLRPYAERAVGTRATPEMTRQRRDLCLAWAGYTVDAGRVRRFASRIAARARIASLAGLRSASRLKGAGEIAARAVFARHDTETGLLLLDALLGIDEGFAPAEPDLCTDPRQAQLRVILERLEAPPLPDTVAVPAQQRIPAAVGKLAGDSDVADHEEHRQ